MSTRADLEAAILDASDAREAYAVYADWLLERGDPAGELVAVQLALEDAPDDPALRARERELLAGRDAELRRLYAYAVSQEIADPVWRRGLLYAVTVGGDAYSAGNAQAYEELLRDPISRFLRELTVRPATVMYGEPTPDDAAIVDAIAAHGAPRALRRLAFDPLGFQISWTRLTDLSPIYRHLPRLEELVISAGDVTLGAIELPALRAFELVTGGLPRHALASVAAARWPHLERLVLYLGAPRYGGDCELADLAALLAATLPSGVRTLGLCNCEFADELVPVLARSPLLPRLRHLDLSQGTLGDAGAQALLEHAAAFRHLDALDLRQSYLGPAARAALSALCHPGQPWHRGPRIELSGQRTPDEAGARYVTVGE